MICVFPDGDQLGLIQKSAKRVEDKDSSDLNRLKISNWLWDFSSSWLGVVIFLFTNLE